MNKKILFIVVLLIPVAIISFNKKETNFSMEKKQEKTIYVTLKKDNQTIKVELEEYVIGVVAGEMPALFEEEALKAQAIASRTYAISKQKVKKELASNTDDQVYITKDEMKNKWKEHYDEYYNKIKKAVNSTENMIMYYENKPINAYYYSSSNGYTESSKNVFNEEKEYLNIQESPWENIRTDTIEISKNGFCQKLKINCSNITIQEIKKDSSNRVESIKINNQKFKGTEIRKKLSLKSTDFIINIKNDNIEIITKGYGHGVGMSQYGANAMAKKGYKYDEILKYYYKNIEISEI